MFVTAGDIADLNTNPSRNDCEPGDRSTGGIDQVSELGSRDLQAVGEGSHRAADKKGVPREKLTGTIQNDILKEYVARGTWIFPVRPSMRLIADSVLYANEQTPRFNPISIAGAHVRDAGSTAVEEMGYTLANGLAYVEEFMRRGGDVNAFAKRLSFFFYVHMDLFEEVAKFRAGRRIWAKLLSERFGVTDEKALHFRFGVVCGGLPGPTP